MGLSPPSEDQKPVMPVKKNSTSSSKSAKPQHRVQKRTGSSASLHQHDHHAQASSMDGRHKRVWKACERCRMKKTKCDGEFPCKRCKDDGLVCTAGVRKKVEFKQLPRGYAEVLENSQFALIATVHKLYSMVRTGEQWQLGEPELNDRGLPVIHDIASRLGAIRPNSDIDLPVHSVFPEDEAGMAELARQLEEQLPSQDHPMTASHAHEDRDSTTSSSNSPRSHSDDGELDMNYRKLAFGGGNLATNMSSPASLTHSLDFDANSSPDFEVNNFSLFPNTVSGGTFTPPTWPEMMQQSVPEMSIPMQQTPPQMQQPFQQQQQQPTIAFRRSQVMNSNFGTMKLEGLSQPSSDPMISMGDPMIYHDFDLNDQQVYAL